MRARARARVAARQKFDAGVYKRRRVAYDGYYTDSKGPLMYVKAFTVMGDSGKEYTIDYDSQGNTRCSCPAFANRANPGDVCKHMRYVAERVLKRPRKAPAKSSA